MKSDFKFDCYGEQLRNAEGVLVVPQRWVTV